MADEQHESFRMGGLARHSFVYGVGMVLTKAVGFLMLPIYTRLLTPADYGIIGLIVMIFEVVTIIAGSRIAWGVFHFFHKETDDDGRRGVLSTAFLLLAATYGFAALATIAAAPMVARMVFGAGDVYVTYVRIAAANMAFQGLSIVPVAVFQLQNRSMRVVSVNLTQIALQVALNLLFLIHFHMGVEGVLWGNMTSNLVVGTALGIHLLASMGLRFRLANAVAFIRFGVPLVLMQVATFVVTFGDRYFLNRSGSEADVGLYALAYQFGFLVVTIGMAPFQRVWDPQRFAVAKRPDRDEIFARVFVYLNLLLFSVALGIALFGGDVIRLMASLEFHSAGVFIPVLAIAYVFQAWGNFLNLGIFITERTEYFTIANWAAAGVALLGYAWLIPQWLAWGATVTTLASLGTRCWLSHLFSQRLWRVEYRWGPVARLGALALGTGIIGVALPSVPLVASIAVHGSLFLLYVVLAWALPILTSTERAAVRRRLAGLRVSMAGAGTGG